MAKIAKYVPQVTNCAFDWTEKYVAEFGGFSPATSKITPFVINDDTNVEELLWNMTVAVEAGAVDNETFLQTFFKSKKDAVAFADGLEEYGQDGEFWVNDRFFCAMEQALNTNEANLSTFDGIADVFREAAADAFTKAKKN